MNKVEKFIQEFKCAAGDPGSIEMVFTSGYCYWFAHILTTRFAEEADTEIMYDEIINHFGARINDKIYDITGDITDYYKWIPFSELIKRDELLHKRLIRDCINKE